jgi:hypothetical protein
MPLITPPTGQIAPGAQFPQLLYLADGTVVTVWTAADLAAAQLAGFGTAPVSGFDYAMTQQAPSVSFPTFNYSYIGKARHPWSWGNEGPNGALVGGS